MLSLLLCASLLAPAQAEAKQPDAAAAAAEVESQVKRLVRQLNSDELTSRQQAEDRLIALGPTALPHLPAVNERTPAEMVQRLARVRQSLQKARAEEASKGSLITLKGKLAPAAILKDFARQSGNTITDHREMEDGASEDQHDVALEKAPFWQALDGVLDAAGLDIDPFAGTGIAIVPRQPGRAPRAKSGSYSGPFRIEPVRFEALRDLRDERNRSLKLFLDVSWEPRLRPIAVSQPLDQVSATADGQPIAVDGEGERFAPLGDESSAIELEIPLKPPARSVDKISLHGKLKVLVPGETETFRFTELPVSKDGGGKKIEQRKAAVTVILDGLRKNNEIWELRLRVRFDDPSNSLDSYLSSWLLSNQALLEKVGPNGTETIEPAGLEQTRQTANEIGVMYLYELPEGPKGWSLVYKTPTAVFDIPVEYEFRDLPLP